MIECRQAKKQYPGFTLDLTMEVPENTISALVGVNGSGKTTLFRLLAGLARADSGTVEVLGQDAWDLTPAQKQEIGVVLADSGFMGCLRIPQIRKILAAFYPAFDGDWFDSLVRRFSLPEDKDIQGFSTGMKARLRVIAAISHRPRLLLLDEPTAGLDVAARNEILDLLREYMETPGHSILVSSHIASDLESLCDDFWMIRSGRIVLHEDLTTLKDDYGIVMIPRERGASVDLRGVIREKQEKGTTRYLVSDRHYYSENYPDLVVENGNLDDLLLMFEGGN